MSARRGYNHSDEKIEYCESREKDRCSLPSVKFAARGGAEDSTITRGLPFYGRSFTIKNPNTGIGLNAPARASAGEAGESTGSAGSLAYYEICDRINNQGWTVVQDPLRRMGPYAYKGNQWVGFDDEDMVRRKAQYIKDMNLGGGMIKVSDYDNFKGKCGEGAYPLLHAFEQVLAGSCDR